LLIFFDQTKNQKQKQKAIGTLVGEVKEGLVEIRNSFAVPTSSEDKTPFNLDFHQTMLDLHHRVSPKEVVIGWYSSTATINASSGFINDIIKGEMESNNLQIAPIHLTLDTDLKNLSLSVRTYTSVPVDFPSVSKSDEQKSLSLQFISLANEIKTSQAENTALDLMSQVILRK